MENTGLAFERLGKLLMKGDNLVKLKSDNKPLNKNHSLNNQDFKNVIWELN